MKQPLPVRMRIYAMAHPGNDEMRNLANALDDATKGFYSEPQTVSVQKFVGAWARARKHWCDVTGEPLI